MVIYNITVADTTKAGEFEGFMLEDIFSRNPEKRIAVGTGR